MMTPGSTISGKSTEVQTRYSQMKFSAVSFELLDCGFPPPTNKHMFCKREFLPILQHKQSTQEGKSHLSTAEAVSQCVHNV